LGKVIEHWANRDDIGTAAQLGWVTPSPSYLIKMRLALRKARRLVAEPADPTLVSRLEPH
jgi:hypothetical protein